MPADKVASGKWWQTGTLALSQRSFAQLRPQGLTTPDHYLFPIRDAAAGAGGMIRMAVAVARALRERMV